VAQERHRCRSVGVEKSTVLSSNFIRSILSETRSATTSGLLCAADADQTKRGHGIIFVEHWPRLQV